jgi:hypothetical protein
MLVLRIEVFRHLTIGHRLELAKKTVRDTNKAGGELVWMLVQ